MCGRFTLRAPAGVIAQQFSLFDVPNFTPSYNIAPTQSVAVVRQSATAAQSQREIVWMHWGLIPSWAQDRSMASHTINARAETASQKPAYRAAFRRRRCLVLADGFYEWQRTDGQKQPYFIHMTDDRPFAFAGLWETWEGSEANYLESCTLLTTEANELMRPIHDRMPVILPPEDHERWLDPNVQDPAAVSPLLRPYPDAEMEAHMVSTYVNSPTHDSPACVEPLKVLF
jgi:putative SOS response-associated peptidase YedK